jgi:hypothetical protein
MKALLALLLGVLVSASVLGQTTNTNCTQIGSQVNCTSTTDNSAQQNAEASRRAGEQMGAAIGVMIARHNQVKNYCKFHPGEQWHSDDWARAGTCKVPNEKTAKVKQVSASSAHFTPDSPEAREWCSHQPHAMTYLGSDGASHYCFVTAESTAKPVHPPTMKWEGEWHVIGNQLQCVYQYTKPDGTSIAFVQLYYEPPTETITNMVAAAQCHMK